MNDREKVVSGLKHCLFDHAALDILDVTNHCNGCPYYTGPECERDLYYDAMELLKAQEPRVRVLSLEEVLDGGECWFDYINGSCGYADVDMQDNKTAIIYRNNRRPVEVPITDYMKKWRCWDKRPTDEQRRAVKWNE